MSDGLIVVVPILTVMLAREFVNQRSLGKIENQLIEHDRKLERIFRKIGRNGN